MLKIGGYSQRKDMIGQEFCRKPEPEVGSSATDDYDIKSCMRKGRMGYFLLKYLIVFKERKQLLKPHFAYIFSYSYYNIIIFN